MNWKKLLGKYAKHVQDSEGTVFLGLCDLTEDEEMAVLESMEVNLAPGEYRFIAKELEHPVSGLSRQVLNALRAKAGQPRAPKKE